MDKPPQERLMPMQFIRRYLGRIVVGLILRAMVYGAMTVVLPYQRERRIAKKIEALGGYVQWIDNTPEWIPAFVHGRLPVWNRVGQVNLVGTEVTDAGMAHLKGLTSLEFLYLDQSQVTDVGLEHLKGLMNLKFLSLTQTRVTDAGMEHLKGLTRLELLYLDQTQVTDVGLGHLKGLTSLNYLNINNTQATPEGRAMLRKALPKCDIRPNP